MTDGECKWAVELVKLYDKYPKLGGVGLNIAQIDERDIRRAASIDNNMMFEEPELGIKMQFVFWADFAPFAVRRSAGVELGGLDEDYG